MNADKLGIFIFYSIHVLLEFYCIFFFHLSTYRFLVVCTNIILLKVSDTYEMYI